jgi:class 3 adenylate cyclase
MGAFDGYRGGCGCGAVARHHGRAGERRDGGGSALRGTVDKFTGDGIMALFGVSITLEDDASRACLAALDIQRETERLAAEVQHRDGVTLQMRVGVNSGQVIAGEIGSGALGYTAIGEQVGMAQRMESVAPRVGSCSANRPRAWSRMPRCWATRNWCTSRASRIRC